MTSLTLLLGWKWNPSNSTHDHCHWYGITCHPHSSCVIFLNLSSSLIISTLPHSISNLTHFLSLSLPHNFFCSPIPSQISRMSHLQLLQLQGNNFSGTIPYGLIGSSSCTTNLTSIDLSNNQLSGALTVDIDVSSSAKCQSLVHLKLFNNQLQDDIPPEIGNCFNLKTLLMDGNIFQGNIPPEIGCLPHLVVLDVSQNSLIGNIPPKLASCTKLSTLILTNLLEIE